LSDSYICKNSKLFNSDWVKIIIYRIISCSLIPPALDRWLLMEHSVWSCYFEKSMLFDCIIQVVRSHSFTPSTFFPFLEIQTHFNHSRWVRCDCCKSNVNTASSIIKKSLSFSNIYRQIGKHESLEGKTNHLSTLNIFVELVVK